MFHFVFGFTLSRSLARARADMLSALKSLCIHSKVISVPRSLVCFPCMLVRLHAILSMLFGFCCVVLTIHSIFTTIDPLFSLYVSLYIDFCGGNNTNSRNLREIEALFAATNLFSVTVNSIYSVDTKVVAYTR